MATLITMSFTGLVNQLAVFRTCVVGLGLEPAVHGSQALTLACRGEQGAISHWLGIHLASILAGIMRHLDQCLILVTAPHHNAGIGVSHGDADVSLGERD